MANNIKGITIEIGGNTGPLTSALKDVEKTSKGLQSELREVNKGLKFDPKNTVLAGQKVELLKQKSQELEKEQEVLKTAVDQAHEAFEKGDLGAEKVRAVERKYEDVNSQLKGTKKQLNEVERTTGTFAQKVKANFSNVKDSIKSAFSLENVKTAIGGIGIAVGGFLASATKSATTAEESTKQLTNLLMNQGMTASQAKQSVDNFTSGITKMSDFSAGEAKQALQALTEKGISAADAIKMEGTLANIAAGQNISLSDASNILVDAYHGKTKALISLGIVTKDEISNSNKAQKSEELQTQVEQKITEKYGKSAIATKLLADMYNHKTDALVKAGVATKSEAKTLDDSSKAALNMNDIQDRLNKRFGGAAQTDLKSYNGQMKAMQNQLEVAKVSIGSALLPVLAQLAGIIAKILAPIAQFAAQNPKLTAVILSLTAIFGILIGGMSVLNTVTTALGTLGISLGGAAVATTTAGTAAGGAAIGFGAMVLPILAVVAAIAGIALIAYEVIKHWSGIKGFFSGLWKGIKSGVSSLGSNIKGAFSSAANGAKSAWNGIGAFFISLWNGIKNTTQSIWNGIKTFFITVWSGIKTAVMAIITPFIQGILNLWNGMKTGITNIFNGLKSVISGIWLAIKTVILGPVLLIIDLVTGNFTKLSSDAQGIFNNLKNAFNLIWNGIKQVFTGTVQAIAGFLTVEWDGIKNITSTVWNGIKNFFSHIWNGITGVIKTAWNGIAKFLSNPDAISNAIKSGWNAAINWIGSLPKKAFNWAKDFMNKYAGPLKNPNLISDAIKSGWDAAINWIKNLPAEALKWGKDMLDGFIKGIKAKFGAIGDAVKGVADGIRSFLHFSTPDEGPLADYESWMPDFMSGLAQGIENNKSLVTNAVKDLATDVNVGMKVTPAMAGIKNNTIQQKDNEIQNSGITQNITINSPSPLSPSEIIRKQKQASRELALEWGL